MPSSRDPKRAEGEREEIESPSRLPPLGPPARLCCGGRLLDGISTRKYMQMGHAQGGSQTRSQASARKRAAMTPALGKSSTTAGVVAGPDPGLGRLILSLEVELALHASVVHIPHWPPVREEQELTNGEGMGGGR